MLSLFILYYVQALHLPPVCLLHYEKKKVSVILYNLCADNKTGKNQRQKDFLLVRFHAFIEKTNSLKDSSNPCILPFIFGSQDYLSTIKAWIANDWPYGSGQESQCFVSKGRGK